MKEIQQTKCFVRYQGKYILLRKIHDAHKDHESGWEVPGGKIENGEDPEQGALREIQEETGLVCRMIAELKLLKLEKDGIKTTTHVYLAEAPTNKVRLSEEHSESCWITYKDIDRLENVIYRDLLKQYMLEADKISIPHPPLTIAV